MAAIGVNPNTGVPVVAGEPLSDEELAQQPQRPAERATRAASWTTTGTATGPPTSRRSRCRCSRPRTGRHSLHSRGNFEGYLGRLRRSEKWLEVHGLEHWTEFYTDYGVALQKRFFGHFLKGEDTGWDEQPPVFLNLRSVDGTFVAARASRSGRSPGRSGPSSTSMPTAESLA